MRNQVYPPPAREQELPGDQPWSWLVPGETPDPDVIDLAAHRRKRDEKTPAPAMGRDGAA